jgi:two-component system nitrate/nitrite response regulator NarL
MNDTVSTLIAAKPGRMRDCLQALLKVVSQIKVIGRADDGASALKLVTELEPALVLLDTNLAEAQVYPVLEQIKATRSQTRCIVLADSIRQRQLAEAAGADAALIKGFRTANLIEVIERLASEHTGGSLPQTRLDLEKAYEH